MSSTDGNGWLNLNQMSSGSALKRPSDGWHDDLQEKLHFPAKRQRRAAAEGLCQWKKNGGGIFDFGSRILNRCLLLLTKNLNHLPHSPTGGDTKCGTCDVLVCRTSFDVDGHRTDTGGSLFVEQKKINYNNVFVYKRMRVKFDASLHSPLICITNSWVCNPPKKIKFTDLHLNLFKLKINFMTLVAGPHSSQRVIMAALNI